MSKGTLSDFKFWLLLNFIIDWCKGRGKKIVFKWNSFLLLPSSGDWTPVTNSACLLYSHFYHYNLQHGTGLLECSCGDSLCFGGESKTHTYTHSTGRPFGLSSERVVLLPLFCFKSLQHPSPCFREGLFCRWKRMWLDSSHSAELLRE